MAMLLNYPQLKSKDRENCRYFMGKLSNGINFARFEPNLHPFFEKLKKGNASIALSSCRVQINKFDSGLEVLTSKLSTVVNSPKKFKLDDVATDHHSSTITIDQLCDVSVNQHVSVICKVVKVDEPMAVNTKTGRKLLKQFT